MLEMSAPPNNAPMPLPTPWCIAEIMCCASLFCSVGATSEMYVDAADHTVACVKPVNRC